MEMKSIFKTVLAAVCCLGVTMFASCDKDDDNSTGLKFSVAKVTVTPGAVANVTVSKGTEPFTVKSMDEKTATVKVDKNILTVTGVKEGRTSVIVTDKKKLTGKLVVDVVASLSFDKTNVEVVAGKEDIVTVKSGKAPYTVSVKDMKIATAKVKDATITVKGVKAGTTMLTVLDKNMSVGTVTVTVK